MKPKSLNFIIELLITITLWVVWFRAADAVLKDALDGDIYQYLNTNIWKVGCSLGLLLSMALVGYAIYRHSHQTLAPSIDNEKINQSLDFSANNEIQSVSKFFELDEIEVERAKSSKKITVDFPISTLKCKLNLGQKHNS